MKKSTLWHFLAGFIAAATLSLSGCAGNEPETTTAITETSSVTTASTEQSETLQTATDDAETPQTENVKRTVNIAVLYTNDVHGAVDDNIGYAGLASYKKHLQEKGYSVILVDSGDALQGSAYCSFSKGQGIIELMNSLGYSAMVLGNHEFDYGGIDRLSELSEVAEFPFLSSNLIDLETGDSLFPPYIMLERDGAKIAIIGVSTPHTTTSSTPAYFMDDLGNMRYDFLADGTGEELFSAVQEQVDKARAEGADYVIALTHLGTLESLSPYCSTELAAATSGIDAILDGHSHSEIDCLRVENAEGDIIPISSTGEKLSNIGLLVISKSGDVTTGLISEWAERDADTAALILAERAKYEESLSEYVATVQNDLLVTDIDTGERAVRIAETNLGDFCADAYRAAGDAEIGFINGGGVRAELMTGDITRGDILSVNPFGNLLCKISATGQQILDALELSAAAAPEEFGGFLQVSGISLDIDLSIPTSVQMDENGMFTGISGERRVSNVTVGDEPLDPERVYTVCASSYTLKYSGDGYAMFADCEVLMDDFAIDVDALTQYMTNGYSENAELYSDPCGSGRIRITE